MSHLRFSRRNKFLKENDGEARPREFDSKRYKIAVDSVLQSDAWLQQQVRMVLIWSRDPTGQFSAWENWQLACMANLGIGVEIARVLRSNIPPMDPGQPQELWDTMGRLWGERVLEYDSDELNELKMTTHEFVRLEGINKVKESFSHWITA